MNQQKSLHQNLIIKDVHQTEPFIYPLYPSQISTYNENVQTNVRLLLFVGKVRQRNKYLNPHTPTHTTPPSSPHTHAFIVGISNTNCQYLNTIKGLIYSLFCYHLRLSYTENESVRKRNEMRKKMQKISTSYTIIFINPNKHLKRVVLWPPWFWYNGLRYIRIYTSVYWWRLCWD